MFKLFNKKEEPTIKFLRDLVEEKDHYINELQDKLDYEKNITRDLIHNNEELKKSATTENHHCNTYAKDLDKLEKKYSELKNNIKILFQALGIKETGFNIPVIQIYNKELINKIFENLKE